MKYCFYKNTAVILKNEFGGGKVFSWILDQHRMPWYLLGLLMQPVLVQDKLSIHPSAELGQHWQQALLTFLLLTWDFLTN